MKLLLIDNYDSFTFNLVQRIGELDQSVDIHVIRNDQITVQEAADLHPSHLLLSPGPCTPRESGICPSLIRHFRASIPILGVCLGHQAIADVHGMAVVRHHLLMHGKTSEIHHDGRGLFRGLSNPFTATRYHSLIVDRSTLTDEFEVSAWTSQGEIMGVRWRGGAGAAQMDGVQFHPESFMTVEGPLLLANFLGLPATEVIAHQEVEGSVVTSQPRVAGASPPLGPAGEAQPLPRPPGPGKQSHFPVRPQK